MSPSRCPPGVLLLLQIAPKLLLPIALVLAAHQYFPYQISGYVWAVAYVFAIPLVLVVTGIVRDIQEEIEIKRLGARRVPLMKSYIPGGIDVLSQMVKSFSNGYMGEILSEWTHGTKNQTIRLRIFGNDVIFTTEPDNIKAVLATNFDNFEKGKEFHRYVESVLGSGVFNSDGDMWKFYRATTRPFFARDRVTDFELFNNHADVAVAKLNARFLEGEAIDFQDVMSRFTLDSATEFLFGSCVHSLSGSLPYAWNSPRRKVTVEIHSNDRFATAFSQAQDQIALRLRLSDIWPLAEFWKDKTKDSMDVIYEYIDPILKEGLDKKTAQTNRSPIEKSEAGPATLLDHLLEQTDDFKVIRDEVLNIMIAGRDTTMCTLTFTVYCLSQHPAILARLREEILAKVGSIHRPTIEDVKDCKYLRAVINETLRLYPPVPFNMRRSKASTTWPSHDGGKPFYIPANVDISYSTFLMHRRADLWGPDVDSFDPDRFLDGRVHKYLTPNPFIFLPFNAGPRICLGQQFAYNETSFMLIRLLQAFDAITLASDAQPPESRPPMSWTSKSGTQGTDKIWPKSHLTLYSYKGLWLKMRPAQQTNTV